MTLTGCHLTGCGATVPPGMVICGSCADDLRRDLLLVPQLAAALESARCKGMRFSSSPVSKRRTVEEEESPLPFNPGASAAERDLVAGLDLVARHAARALGWSPPLATADSLGPWLAEQVTQMRASVLGPGWAEDLRRVLGRAWRAVDAPPEVKFAGPCGSVGEPCPVVLWVNPEHDAAVVVCPGCGAEHEVAELWGRCPSSSVLGPVPPGPGFGEPWSPGPCDALRAPCSAEVWVRAGSAAGTVVCSGCGARHDIRQRRAWLLEQANEHLLPATELARAVDGLGVAVTPSTVRKWAERQRIVPRGHAMIRGRLLPLYRVGDVLDLVEGDARRREAKSAHGVSRAGA